MRKKKISDLDTKSTLAPTDIIPIVDTELARRKTKKTTIADIVAAVDAVPNDQKGQPGGVATLDPVTGRLPISQLPPAAITDTFSVNSQAAMLALAAQIGDIAIRTDVNKTYILAQSNPGILSNWQEILTPGGSLSGLTDVDPGDDNIRGTLVFNPDTGLWENTDIATLLDGGAF